MGRLTRVCNRFQEIEQLFVVHPYLPFHYFPGFEVASGAASTARDLGVLVATAAMLVVVAYWRFEKRDL